MRLVLTTFSHPGDAARIIHSLVEEKLIACGTLLPQARSIYSWQGKVHDREETVVLLKTAEDRLPELEKRLKALHPHEVPEIIAIPPDSVLPEYAVWIDAETRPPQP
jgi:periplasmic divalent cation tolerance protein